VAKGGVWEWYQGCEESYLIKRDGGKRLWQKEASGSGIRDVRKATCELRGVERNGCGKRRRSGVVSGM